MSKNLEMARALNILYAFSRSFIFMTCYVMDIFILSKDDRGWITAIIMDFVNMEKRKSFQIVVSETIDVIHITSDQRKLLSTVWVLCNILTITTY